MTEAWIKIETMLNEMRPLLIEAGILQDRLLMPQGDPRRIRCAGPLAWLTVVHDTAWAEANKIKRLLPQEIWDYYKIQEFQDMREQVMLEAALKKLVKAWKTERPSFFRRKLNGTKEKATIENSDHETSTGMCV